MPDWHELVRQRLSGLALDAAEKQEVHAELASHLEESYESFRREGLSEQAGLNRTLAQVENWQDLRRKICAAKKEHFMQSRLRQLWIPGFLTLILSMLFQFALQKEGFQPRIVSWVGPGTVLLPWLVSLPFFGSLGAYISLKGGGSRGTALLATIFPVLALTAAFLLMFPIGLMIQWVRGSQGDFSIVATVLLRDGIGWLLVPGAALLAGGFSAVILFIRRSSSHHAVIV